MKIFESVASMKLATLNPNQFVETGGYYTKGGSGAAKYFIKAPQAADGYGDHVIANGNVAVLVVEGDADVTQFGARATNASTYESLNALAIQACLDAHLNVCIPEGTWRLSAGLVLRNYQKLFGGSYNFSNTSGTGGTYLKFNISGGAGLTCGYSVTLEKMTLLYAGVGGTYDDATFTYGTGTSVGVQLQSNATIRDCTFILW